MQGGRPWSRGPDPPLAQPARPSQPPRGCSPSARVCPRAWADLSSFQLLTGFAARIKPVMWVHSQLHSAEEKAGGQGRCPCPSYLAEGRLCPQSVRVPCSGGLGAQLHHLLWASASPWDVGMLKLAILSGLWMVGASGWYGLQAPHLEQLFHEPEPGGIRP